MLMDFVIQGVPATVALAVVAVLGYLFGRASRHDRQQTAAQSRREMKRAKAVIRELEEIARTVRQSLAAHHASILNFKDRVSTLSDANADQAAWKELSGEAEKMLKPTMRLATQIAHAYDEIRQQTNQLMTFTEVRTDPLTGLSNRRALDETLDSMLAMLARYRTQFALVMIDIDHFKKVNDELGHLQGDDVLKDVARIIDACARETDLAIRYGGEEFVVILPHTDLGGACVFAERLRRSVETSKAASVTVSCGAAAAMDGDNARTLVARADSALYSAKASGRNRAFQHTGSAIEAIAATTDGPPERRKVAAISEDAAVG